VVVARQPVDRGGFERLRAVAVQVADGHEDLERLILHGLAAEREERLQDIVRFFPGGGQTREFAVVFALRMIGEKGLPHIQVAGNVRLAVGIQAQPRGEQHHVGVGAENRPRRSGAGDAPSHRGVEARMRSGCSR
jgi:hypothetical protein